MAARILCVLDGSEGDAARLSFAEALATRIGARVAATLALRLPEVLAITDPSGSAFLRELIARGDAEAKAALLKLDPQVSPELTTLSRLDAVPGHEQEELIQLARLADLVIAATPVPDGLSPSAAEALLFRSGRPCLLVPPGVTEPALHKAMIGWKSCREAALALGASLPLLRLFEAAHVVIVEEGKTKPAPDAAVHVERYLADHGIRATSQIVRDKGPSGPALRAVAAEIGADLMVMGGYGHSRMREMVMGGATLDVLTHTNVAVLMAH